jgi:hypothetical protein
MKRVLIQELKCVGHCVPYALDLAEIVASGSDEVLLVLNGILKEDSVFMSRIEEISGRVDIRYSEPMALDYNAPETAQVELGRIRSHIDTFEPHRVLLPTADTVVRWSAFDREHRSALRDPRRSWELVIHSIPASSPGLPFRHMLRALNSSLTLHRSSRARLLTPEPYCSIGPGRNRLVPGANHGLGLLPYPMPNTNGLDRVAARRALQLPETGRLLVVPGVVDPRKSILRLLDARPQLTGMLDGIVLAGPVAETLRSRVHADRAKPGPTLHVLDRFLAGDDFVNAFLAADLVWAVYPRWCGISTIQFLAARLNRRCLVDQTHLPAVWVAQKTPGCAVVGASIGDAVGGLLDEAPGDAGFVRAITSSEACRAVLCDHLTINSLDGLQHHVSSLERGRS